MEYSFPVWSAPCMHLEPLKNSFKLLKIDMTIWLTWLLLLFWSLFCKWSQHENMNMFLIYGEPANEVCTLPLPETTFKLLKNYMRIIWTNDFLLNCVLSKNSTLVHYILHLENLKTPKKLYLRTIWSYDFVLSLNVVLQMNTT
jgi:hypothetical protein